MNNSSQPRTSRKKAQGKKRKQMKKNKSNSASQRPRGHLSQCSTIYALAMSNPFLDLNDACVPDNNTSPSYKFSVRGTGSFSIGTGGVGYVIFGPKRFGNDFSASNSPIYFTGSTYAGTTITTNTATAGVNNNNLARFPFPLAEVAPLDKKLRVVGAGIRIFYQGTELNRGGTILAFREMNNNSCNGASESTLASWTNTKLVPVDRRKHSVTWKPVQSSDFDYYDSPNDVSQNNSTYYANAYGPCCMGFLVSGSTTGNSFKYEIVTHYECLGSNVRQSPSSADSAGMSAVFSAIPPIIETVSSVMSGDVLKGAVKALEGMSGLYFGPPTPPPTITISEL
jgi:hypothetical protein